MKVDGASLCNMFRGWCIFRCPLVVHFGRPLTVKKLLSYFLIILNMTMFINSVLYLMPAIQQIATIDLVEFYYTRELHFSLAWIVTPLLNVCLIYIGIIRLKCLKMGIFYLLNAKAIICNLYLIYAANILYSPPRCTNYRAVIGMLSISVPSICYFVYLIFSQYKNCKFNSTCQK